ncbi:MAG: glucose PTS transporter subunit IIA [Coriobacteriia bacterium]|nr:glucose PTS transporter subunit IIA [Coriobacteriia bacterium]
MADSKLAEAILAGVGGKENVDMLTHCATRLRFTLKDASIVDGKKLDSTKGVMGVVPQGDTSYQIVIGGGVADVYEDVNALLGKKSSSIASNDDVKAKERDKIKGKNKFVDSFFEFLSDSFRPIIGVLLGASLIIAIINLLITFGVIKDASDTPSTLFLNAIAQAVFYFLPVMIAYNACKKLKVDPWVGAVCMLALFTPQFLALMSPEMYSNVFSATGPGKEAALGALNTFTDATLGKDGTTYVTQVFNLPMILFNYKGNVFVPLLMSGCLALLYKGLKKIIPPTVQLVFVPFLAMLIMVPFTAFVIGPIGVTAGSYLGIGLAWLNNNAPFIFAIAIPLLYPFLVPLGLHWPLNALMLVNIDTLGYDFIQGPMGCWNFACFGATFGVLYHALRERDVEMLGVSGGALAAGFLGGVSEPSLYGIHLRYKKIYKRMIPGCLAGGVTIAVLGFLFPSSAAPGVTTTAFAFTSLLTIPVFNQVWVYAISIAVAFIVAAGLVIALDYRTPQQKAKMRAFNAAGLLGLYGVEDIFQYTEEEQAKLANKEAEETFSINLNAPISGKGITLKESGDKVFAMKALGDGMAIVPDKQKAQILSPIDGKLTAIAVDLHAYTIMGDNGVGVLVHVGVDTVNLHGKGFKIITKQGSEVKAGQAIAEVDFPLLDKEGYKIPVFVTVVNTNNMQSVDILKAGEDVKAKDAIINVIG